MEGISVKSLYMELGMSIVIQLYLLESETSLLISLPHGLNIILTLWKIAQASKVERCARFPFFKLSDKASYSQNETQKYD
jgi:Cleft lip and palate transmembrane protein 1 (CLPTM1)